MRVRVHHTGVPEDVAFHAVGQYQVERGVTPSYPIELALENQTRTVYSKLFFGGHINTFVVAHETAHQ